MSVYLWLAIFVLAFIIEIITASSLVSIWFAFGSLFGLLTSYLGFSLKLQFIVFILSSILFFVIFKPIVMKLLAFKKQATNFDRYIGKRFYLLKAINQEKGTIKINDLIYNAVSNNGDYIEKGQLVELLAFEGSKVIVRKVMENE